MYTPTQQQLTLELENTLTLEKRKSLPSTAAAILLWSSSFPGHNIKSDTDTRFSVFLQLVIYLKKIQSVRSLGEND